MRGFVDVYPARMPDDPPSICVYVIAGHREAMAYLTPLEAIGLAEQLRKAAGMDEVTP